MKIQVDFYKPSGKWYAGGIVDIGDAKLWRDESGYNSVAVAIGKNQQILHSGAITRSEFITVARNIDGDPDADVPGNFCCGLFHPSDFPPGDVL
jgi:hypothetical protein